MHVCMYAYIYVLACICMSICIVHYDSGNGPVSWYWKSYELIWICDKHTYGYVGTVRDRSDEQLLQKPLEMYVREVGRLMLVREVQPEISR